LNILSTLSPAIFYAVLLAIQYFLSRTGNKIVGAIVPVIFVIVLIYLYLTEKLGLNIWGAIIFGIIGLLFLLGQWDSAQKDKKKKMEKELDKMEGKDLN
jgi:O-antigen/teichoic acid export membrane protein